MKTEHTPTPWRIGDAGHTVFGPPNGTPSPVTIAPLSIAKGAGKANARFIVRAVNSHEALVEALTDLVAFSLSDEANDERWQPLARARAALKLAEG